VYLLQGVGADERLQQSEVFTFRAPTTRLSSPLDRMPV